MATEPLELLQFLHSNYNEKVRWALAWKRVPHRKTTLLPGPQAFTVLRLTGQTQTPVVRVDGRVIAGSARILEEIERRHPTPPLVPADPALRRRALELPCQHGLARGSSYARFLNAIFPNSGLQFRQKP